MAKSKDLEVTRFHFGRTASQVQKFTDEQAALQAAKQLANQEDEPVDLYRHPAGALRPKVYRRILPD